MLLSINLQLPESGNASLETGAVGDVPADAVQFSASFAQQLEIPAETGLLQDLAMAGQALPPTGNELPQLPGDFATDVPQDQPGFSEQRPADETRLEGQPLAGIARELAVDVTHTLAAQVQASSPAPVALADNVHPANPDRLSRAIAGSAIYAQRDLSMAEPETPQQTRRLAGRIGQATPVAVVPQDLAYEDTDSPLGEADMPRRTLTEYSTQIMQTTATGNPLGEADMPRRTLTEYSTHIMQTADTGNPPGEADMPRRTLAEYSTQIMQTADISGSRQAAAQTITNTVVVADSAALQLQVPDRPTPNATPPAFTSSVDIPVKDTAWGDAINQQVLVMAGKKNQTAEIRLTPAELGPLRIQLSFDDGAAEVTFVAQHALTREALEGALPRLRDLFLDNGIALGHASVSEDGVEHGRHGSESTLAESGADGDTPAQDHTDDNNVMTSSRTLHDGLIDTFV